MAETTDSNQDQLQKATVRLYEDESLTGALTDEAATLMLGWGEQQLKKLACAPPNQADPDNTTQELRRTLRLVNRLVERRAELSDTELVQQLLKLMDQVIMLTLLFQKPISEEPSYDQTTQTLQEEINPEEKLW